jgi:hypothetical protein
MVKLCAPPGKWPTAVEASADRAGIALDAGKADERLMPGSKA